MNDATTAREFIQRETGQDPGIGIELSFDELGLSQDTLNRSVGKVGFRAKLTEFFKSAKQRARTRNPIAPNQADIVKWIIYDRFTFAAGTTVPNNFKFFTQPIGSGGKTKVDTNMEQVQRLADPLWFNTEGVGFFWLPGGTGADLGQFLATTYMEFWVGQKVYLEGPIQCFPGGGGISGITRAGSGTVSGEDLFCNGVPRVDNIYDVRLPNGIHLGTDSTGAQIITDGLIGITILQGQQFRVEMNAPAGGVALQAGGTGLSVMCYLHGILSRGVQ